MTESELAFNANGEPFALPETATGWRVRRLRGGRGAPELVYGRDGRPLTLGIDAGMDELRDAVEVSGRYRLDAIDDDGKAVADLPPSYVQVTVAERNSSLPEAAPTALSSTDFAIRELTRATVEIARANSELAKTVSTQQPELVTAAAEIVRAADGAGLSRRELVLDQDEVDDVEAAVDGEGAPARSMLDLNTLMSRIVPMIEQYIQMKVMTMHGPAPTAEPASVAVTGHAHPSRRTSPPGKRAQPAAPATPTIAPNPMAHMMMIQAQLTPEERARVEAVRRQLTPANLKQWADQLATMTVEEAVEAIRAEMAKRAQNTETAKTEEHVS